MHAPVGGMHMTTPLGLSYRFGGPKGLPKPIKKKKKKKKNEGDVPDGGWLEGCGCEGGDHLNLQFRPKIMGSRSKYAVSAGKMRCEMKRKEEKPAKRRNRRKQAKIK